MLHVQVTDEHITLGTIEFDTGFVNVVTVYRAICFRPFVNEVLDASVSHVTELGFFAEVGPLEVFVSRLVRRDMLGLGRLRGSREIFRRVQAEPCFAPASFARCARGGVDESLPCSCIAPLQGMPDDIASGYDPVGDMWVSAEDSDTEIKAGCGVRLRIIGVTVGAELVSSDVRRVCPFTSMRVPGLGAFSVCP